jgi:uncharacterized protein
MDSEALYYLVAGVLVLVGLLGVILPALPGVPLMFAGMWLASWAGGYARVGYGMLVVLGLLTLLSVIVDILATLLGAKRVGASRSGLIGAALGTVVGLFFGIAGLIAGPFLGALTGEWLHGREIGAASRVGFGTWLGLAFAAVLKLTLAFTMLGLFAFAWWW